MGKMSMVSSGLSLLIFAISDHREFIDSGNMTRPTPQRNRTNRARTRVVSSVQDWDEGDGISEWSRLDTPDTPRDRQRLSDRLEGKRKPRKGSPAFEIDDGGETEDDEDNSEDDGLMNDGAEVYQKFKNRDATRRKAVAAKSRKARAAVAAASKKKDSLIGKKPRKNAKDQSKKREWDQVSSDEDLMEHTLPEYLKKRRTKFDQRMDQFKAAGLKLPPSYDDVDFSDDDRLHKVKEKPDFKSTPARKYVDITLPYSLGLIPASIAQWLRDYQVEGVAFLHELFVYQKGGILGDDMGLGKTVQVIAFLTAAYGKTGDERDAKRMRKMRRRGDRSWYPRTLIICPGTLIQNWKSEFDRWGWWHVDVFHGSDKDSALQAAASGRVEVLITTYTTYRINQDSINMIEWDCVVADECHTIKERKSGITQAMNEINALCRLGLTGTAIQNKYEELWTLLNWTNPGKFGPVTAWRTTISEPLKIGQSHDATVAQLSKARKTAKKLVENLLPEFFLRRMKTLIADQLPKKSDRVVFCPLTSTQGEAYETFLDGEIVRKIKDSTEPCHCGSGKKQGWCCGQFLSDGSKWQAHVFPAIQTLQKLANHVAILIPQSGDAKEKAEKDLETLQIAMPDRWRDLWRDRDSIMNYANPEFCGKWKILKKLLGWWFQNGDKVLIFSHSVRLLKMLKMLLTNTSYNVSYLDGTMALDDRAKAVDDFNADPQQFVFLISTRAGGVGLNITSANKVVVVDPNWNPSYDLQAQDRAYRIGQLRDVEVFRLVSAGTIEEIVYARQIYKQQQANIGYNASTERRYFSGVQEKSDQKGEIFGLRNLFEYQDNNVVLRDIVNKTNVAESRAGVSVVDFDHDHDSDSDNEFDQDSNSQNDPLGAMKLRPDDDDENAAMSQLAALVRGDDDSATQGGRKRKRTSTDSSLGTAKSKKHDPVQAILAGAGVQYTHENSEVIGSSRVEARLSKRAEETAAGTDLIRRDEQVFLPSQPQLLRSARATIFATGTHDSNANNSNSGISTDPRTGETLVRLKYKPPEDVMRRQFCSMAARYDFASPTEFALVVEGMTQKQRRAVLERWYRERREIASKMLRGEDVDDDAGEETTKAVKVCERKALPHVRDSKDESISVPPASIATAAAGLDQETESDSDGEL